MKHRIVATLFVALLWLTPACAEVGGEDEGLGGGEGQEQQEGGGEEGGGGDEEGEDEGDDEEGE